MQIRVNKREKRQTITTIALGMLLALPASARADDTADEIRALKAQLKRLEAKVNEQARSQKETQVQIRAVSSKTAPAAAAAAASPGMPSYSGIGVGSLGGVAPTGFAAREAAIRGLPVPGAPSLYINGVSITPGGFLALEGLFRDRFIGADIATPFNNIPYSNVRTGNANEFRFTSRQSRLNLLTKADINPTTHIAGFLEIDFLSAAQTANSNESNSFNPRMRQLYMTLDQDDFGAHFFAGQAWSFATPYSNGLLARSEALPLTIEHQLVPGFVWTRQPGLRVIKDWDKTLWAGLAVESPQTTFSGGPFPGAGPYVGGLPTATAAAALPSTLVFNQLPPGGSLFNSLNAVSLNHFPDVIGKVAWDPTIADRHIHFEAIGIFRDFYSQVNNHNQDVASGAFGGSLLVPIIPKQLEFQFSGLTGRGIGRYGTSQLPDVTFNSSGYITPLQETMLFGGLIWHAMPELDLYTYAGEEITNASYNTVTTAGGGKLAYGYGNPLYTNAGCTIAGSTVCVGNVALVRQITGGFWDKIYQGDFGQLRVGMQYSFTQKYSFPGIGGTAKAQENIVMGSIRYYPF
ncbi:conserved exported hypothetical protein [Methylocella tundrae]|uniref:Porin n=1 Tax=Methylocella tundrae TaxID=227605 RepID=A0A8B6M3M3_METTU|nr:conserved exported hypothetical protein [Methylocella tundrae]